VLNNVGRLRLTVIDLDHMEVITVSLAVVPRAHNMTRAPVVEINHYLLIDPVVPFCHVPTCLSGFGTGLFLSRLWLSAGVRLRVAGLPWPFA
jgi:hypothetical protein